MKARAQVVNDEDVEVKIEMTVTVGDLRLLMRQQPPQWPAGEFGRILASVIGKTVGRLESEHSAEP